MTSTTACVLLDVGGTIWSDYWTSNPEVRLQQEMRLNTELPDLPLDICRRLVDQLYICNNEYKKIASTRRLLTQNNYMIVKKAIEKFGIEPDDLIIEKVCRSMSISAVGNATLFPGAYYLLQQVRLMGCRCIVVSNATWRNTETYKADFGAFEISKYINEVICSVDVGFRKPHTAMFNAALSAEECPPQHCLMIGNSEEKDIYPAMLLGMHTMLVAIEQPAPVHSVANMIANSLYDAARYVQMWFSSL